MKKLGTLTTLVIVLAMLAIFPIGSIGAASDSLVAYWAMDEGIGAIATDSSGYANDGELSGGIDGNAVQFDGVDDVVVIPDSLSLQLTGSFTIEAWIYPESTPIPEVGWGVIAAKWENTSYGTAGIFFALKGNKLFGRLSTNGSNYFDVTGGTNVTTGAWHHVALVLDTSSTKVEVYLDGALDGTTTNAALSSVNGNNGIDVTIGAYNYVPSTQFDNPFDGKIDEVRISNSAVYPLAGLPATPPLDASGAVGLWHMDESVDTIAFDATANGNNGTLMNDASWAGPIWSNSLSFDGIDDFVSVPDSASLDGMSALTVEAWVYIHSAEGYYIGIVDKTAGSADRSYNLGLRNGKLEWGLANAVNSKVYARDAVLAPTNSWVHVVGTYDGNTMRLYRNGVEVDSATQTGSVQNSATYLALGRWPGDSYFFDGLLDGVRIWNRSLSADEVKSLLLTGEVGTLFVDKDGVVGYDPFDCDGTGVTVYDKIQDAVDAANDHDTIRVCPGTYAGALIDKSLEIKGTGGATINDGPPHPHPNIDNQGFRFLSGSDGATIGHFTFENVDLAIMNGEAVNDVTIEHNTFLNSIQAISNWRGSGWKISHNEIVDLRTICGGGIGILVADFAGGVVQDNAISHNKISGTLHVSEGDCGGYDGSGIVLYADFRWGGAGAYEIKNNSIVKNTISLVSDTPEVVDVNAFELTDTRDDTSAHPYPVLYDNAVGFNDFRGTTIQLLITPEDLADCNDISRNLGDNRGHGLHPSAFGPGGN